MKSEFSRVFVYGTLLRGESNHRLLAQAEFVREARTGPVFELVDLGPYPVLLAEGRTSVTGEVYSVDKRTLERLDRLEGHPHFYTRKLITLEDGENVETYIFSEYKIRKGRIITSGSWKDRPKKKS